MPVVDAILVNNIYHVRIASEDVLTQAGTFEKNTFKPVFPWSAKEKNWPSRAIT